jgi:hypothetical protein
VPSACRLIVGDGYLIGNSFVRHEDISAAGRFSERCRHRHLAAKFRIGDYVFLLIW